MKKEEFEKTLKATRKRLRRPKDDKCVGPAQAKELLADILELHAPESKLKWHQGARERIRGFLEKQHTCDHAVEGEACPYCAAAEMERCSKEQ